MVPRQRKPGDLAAFAELGALLARPPERLLRGDRYVVIHHFAHPDLRRHVCDSAELAAAQVENRVALAQTVPYGTTQFAEQIVEADQF